VTGIAAEWGIESELLEHEMESSPAGTPEQAAATTKAAASVDPRAGGSGYLPTLDGWRALAIVVVMLQHAQPSIHDAIGDHFLRLQELMFKFGRVGVYLFFGLSGFLICTRLLEEEQKNGRISLRGFYIRRCFRIFPPSLFYLSVVGVLSLAGIAHTTLFGWLSALLFFANYVEGIHWYVAHFWSLAMEEHFYLFWPALLLFVGRTRAIPAAMAIVLAIYIWRLVAIQIGWLEKEIGWHYTDIRLDVMLWGCIIALLYAQPAWRDRFKTYLTTPAWLVLVALFVATGFLGGKSLGMKNAMTIVQAIVVPLLIVGTVLRPTNWIGVALEWSALRWLGRLSYSLYLWQQLFLVWSEFRSPSMGVLQTFPLNFVCALLCAVGSYYLIERPMIKVGHRMAKPVTAGRSDLKS
jgi:peptidoglycan/LPS O-acetylase OafA/YrhL